jgi:hypothetical protein
MLYPSYYLKVVVLDKQTSHYECDRNQWTAAPTSAESASNYAFAANYTSLHLRVTTQQEAPRPDARRGGTS